MEATILTGPFEGEAVLIPRILMIPTDLTSCISASFTQLKICTLHTCCWGTFWKKKNLKIKKKNKTKKDEKN